MKATYKEYKQLDLTRIGEEIRAFWEKEDIFKKSLDNRRGNEPFVFYEGPPSANGIPGIHHVMARAIKDIFVATKPSKANSLIAKPAGIRTDFR